MEGLSFMYWSPSNQLRLKSSFFFPYNSLVNIFLFFLLFRIMKFILYSFIGLVLFSVIASFKVTLDNYCININCANGQQRKTTDIVPKRENKDTIPTISETQEI